MFMSRLMRILYLYIHCNLVYCYRFIFLSCQRLCSEYSIVVQHFFSRVPLTIPSSRLISHNSLASMRGIGNGIFRERYVNDQYFFVKLLKYPHYRSLYTDTLMNMTRHGCDRLCRSGFTLASGAYWDTKDGGIWQRTVAVGTEAQR